MVGLCYPSFAGNGTRMVSPFITLTIGNMFKDTPGFLSSLTVTIPDGSTWEIANGLKLPKHIQCNCNFTYVGKYLPSTLGKHYELPWLKDDGWGKNKSGTFHTKFNDVKGKQGPNVKGDPGQILPVRLPGKPALFSELADKRGTWS